MAAGIRTRLKSVAKSVLGRGTPAGDVPGGTPAKAVAYTLASTAHFPTERGSQYLQQFCKHFSHKVPVSYDPQEGQVTLHTGRAHFSADETGLGVRIEAVDVRGLIEARFVVDKHLAVFAFRDKFSGFSWSAPEPI